jgi:serine/threonine protein kinase
MKRPDGFEVEADRSPPWLAIHVRVPPWGPGGLEGGSNPSGTTGYVADFVPPAPADLAAHFPQLEILELLGKGGMGAVYKARQSKLDRLVALKILPPEAGRDPAFAERFTREARALARLNHPHVVAVHDFGESHGLYYFIMEYVDGANLRHLMTAGGLTAAQTLQIVPKICEALQYAHDEGIVHRDIKPENILLDKKGRVKIADFGLAKLLGQTAAPQRLTGTRQVMGTPHYMAPEQLEKPLGVDHRADIYSVGVVFYEMLTGELPLGHFALPSHKVPVDARLDEVVLRALEKEPDDRYQHVSDLEREVATIATGGGATPAEGAARTPGATRRSSARRYSVPFKVEGFYTQTHGLIRYENHSLIVEYILHHWFSKSEPKEATIAVRDLSSILWKKTRIILTAHRLSILQRIPGSTPGQAELMIARPHRKTAEQLVAHIQERLQEEETAGMEPEAPGEASPSQLPAPPKAKGLILGRVKALFQSVLYYCVNTIQSRRAPAPPPPALPREPLPPDPPRTKE